VMAFKGEVLTVSELLARAAATLPEAEPPVSTSARDAAGVAAYRGRYSLRNHPAPDRLSLMLPSRHWQITWPSVMDGKHQGGPTTLTEPSCLGTRRCRPSSVKKLTPIVRARSGSEVCTSPSDLWHVRERSQQRS